MLNESRAVTACLHICRPAEMSDLSQVAMQTRLGFAQFVEMKMVQHHSASHCIAEHEHEHLQTNLQKHAGLSIDLSMRVRQLLKALGLSECMCTPLSAVCHCKMPDTVCVPSPAAGCECCCNLVECMYHSPLLVAMRG